MDAVAAGLERVRDAAGRAWSLSEGELRDSVVELARVRSRAEAAYLAVVKVLDDRPEAVPGAPLDRAGSVFLQERVHLDPARANADVGAALAAGDITREHADVCVRAAAKLPKRLHLVTVVDEATGEAVLGMTAVDRWLAGQAHVTAWSAGGGTALTNLVLLCPRHHQHVHAGIPDVKIHDGRAWVRLPAWMDRSRPWVRNLLHTAHHEADRIAQQLRLALDTHDPTRDAAAGTSSAIVNAVTIDRLTPDDWETLRDLRLRALLTDPDSFGSTWEDEQDGDEPWWRTWLAEQHWLVARGGDGTPLGMVAVVPPRPPGDGAGPAGGGTGRGEPGAEPFTLNGLWVAPEARGEGVARDLARQVVALAGGAGVVLTVVDGNTAARDLFTSLGFRPTGERYPRERDPSRWNERLSLTPPG